MPARRYDPYGSKGQVIAMGLFDEDDRPKKKLVHEIGQDLSLISVEELKERIALLEGEIERLKADMAAKEKSRSAAESVFKI